MLRRVLAPVSLLCCLVASDAVAQDLNSAQSIKQAIEQASAGDVLELEPGTYVFSGAIRTRNAGTEEAPITLTSKAGGRAVLKFSGVEGLIVLHPHWVVRGIGIDGCAGGACQAGLHIKPNADHLLVEGNVLTNWTQHIKSSRTVEVGGGANDVRVIGNEFYNTTPFTGRGSTPIDVVGGDRWLIARNYVHDYGGSNNGNYGIFIKGVTRDSVIEQNLVVGYTSPEFKVGASVGISFGGGGTGKQFVPNNDNSCEDFNSIARNNIVAQTTDAGLHTKRACGSKFYHNTVFDVGAGLQIQINGAGDPVDIQRNIFQGRITGQDNRTEQDNLIQASLADFTGAYTDPANLDFSLLSTQGALFGLARTDEVMLDYCDVMRAPDSTAYGAVSSQGCSTWPWTSRAQEPQMPSEDASQDMDAMDASEDMPPSEDQTPDTSNPSDTSPDAAEADMSAPDMSSPSPETEQDGCASASGAAPSPLGLLLGLVGVMFGVGRRLRTRS